MDKDIAIYNKQAFVIIASRPGMGKTSLALDIARHLAKRSNKKILIISLDMSKEQVMARLQKAENMPAEFGNILIDDQPLRSVKDIEELCQNTENLGAVIIDYLQLLIDDRQTQEKSSIRKLKQMTGNLDIPVICTCQTPRACDFRENKRPLLDDLLITEADYQYADQVLLLYRDRYYNPKTEAGDIAECIVAKNIYGNLGTVRLHWDPARLSFSEQEQ